MLHKNEIYPQIYIEPKYGTFYSNNEVRVNTLSLFKLEKAPHNQKKNFFKNIMYSFKKKNPTPIMCKKNGALYSNNKGRVI